MSIKDVRTRDEIIISIDEPDTGATDGAGKRKRRGGVIPARKSRDYLPRRAAKKGFINFYDLALQKISGVFVDKNLVVSKTFPAGVFVVVTEPLTVADLNTIFARFFTVPLADWKDNYKKLDLLAAANYDIGLKINDVSVSLDGANADWTTDGLKKKITKFSIQPSGAFNRISDTSNAALYKITASFDYAADAVLLPVMSQADIFFVPQLAFQYVQTEHGSPATVDTYDDLFINFAPFSRVRLLPLGFFLSAYTNPAPSFAQVAAINNWISYFKTQPLTRYFSQDLATGSPYIQQPGVAAFPNAENSIHASAVSILNTAVSILPGQLLAVIQTPDKVFYIWAKTFAFNTAKGFILQAR